MSSAAEVIRDKYAVLFESDFIPLIRFEQAQGAAERSAYADEFAAHQLGQINKKLGRLVALLEQGAGLR